MRDKEIAITIRGKEFKINFVSNYVSVEFNKLSKQINRVVSISSEISQLSIDVGSGVISDETATNKIEEMTVEVDKISQSLFPKRLELIQELLESNNIEYDKSFWEKKTTPQDLNDFLYRCYTKDYDDAALKKSLDLKTP